MKTTKVSAAKAPASKKDLLKRVAGLTNKGLSKSKKNLLKKVVSVSNRATVSANKKFEKLSPSEKRVAIARDVLTQLASKRLVPKAGAWLEVKGGSELFSEKMLGSDQELQEILSKTKECTGCALGGLFLSAVCKADKLKLSELECVDEDHYNSYNLQFVGQADISMKDSFSYLKRFFSEDQLNLIEFTFELGLGAVGYNDDGKDKEKLVDASLASTALEFFNFKDYDLLEDLDADTRRDLAPTDLVRMRLIMENIVVNKGKFDPNKKPIITYHTPKFVG